MIFYFSILLDEEGHIKITGQFLQLQIVFFYFSVFIRLYSYSPFLSVSLFRLWFE